MKDLEVVQVIRTELERRGNGTVDSPVRRITQYWSMEGELLWENDPLAVESTIEIAAA